ncbi:MAG: hypothetical protein ACO3N7_11910, partial [Kiritimatiellia bacterium]
DPTPWRQQADDVAAAIQERLWNPSTGRFAASGEDPGSPCLHGQVLALRFGIGDAHTLLTTIEPELRANFRQGIERGQNSGHLELYFQVYLLPALEALERFDLAEALILEHFALLQSLGHPSLNECFCRANHGVGSCCHSWSGYAAVYATRNILGLRQATPGNPNCWIFAPRTHISDKVSGTLPIQGGKIEVTWTRKNGSLSATINHPEEIEIHSAENILFPDIPSS